MKAGLLSFLGVFSWLLRDTLVSLIAVQFMKPDEPLLGFGIAFLGLQALWLASWAIRSAWALLWYFAIGKTGQRRAYLALMESLHLPAKKAFYLNAANYLEELSSDEKLDHLERERASYLKGVNEVQTEPLLCGGFVPMLMNLHAWNSAVAEYTKVKSASPRGDWPSRTDKPDKVDEDND